MAGVNFELNKAVKSNDKSFNLGSCLWSTFACCGSMLFSFLLLYIFRSCVIKYVDYDVNINAFMSYVTNTVFFSMIMYSFLSYPISRYIADLIYAKKYDHIISSFWGAIFCLGMLGIILYLPILLFSHLNLVMIIIMIIFLFVLISNWIVIGYVTILKEYRKICLSFLAGFCISILGLIISILFKCCSVEFLIGCLILGYGTTMTLLYKTLNNCFKINGNTSFEFLKVYNQYPKLFFISVFSTLGTLLPFYIFWFSSHGTIVNGFFRSNSAYDIPAILAYLTTLFTIVYFVAVLEPNFYGYYKKYFTLLNTRGTFENIGSTRNDMVRVLKGYLKQMTYWQMIVTFVAAILGSMVLYMLNIGMTQTMLGTFRLLCAGFFFLGIGNSLLLVQLYFSDYNGAFKTSIIFFMVTTIVSFISSFQDQSYWGIGVIAGAFIMCIVAIKELEKLLSNIEYYVLSSNSLVKKKDSYFIHRNFDKLICGIKKINKGMSGMIVRIVSYLIVIAVFFVGIINYDKLIPSNIISNTKILKSDSEITFVGSANFSALKNPGVGFAPWAKNDRTLKMDTTLVYVDLSFAELEPQKGVYDFNSFEEKNHLEEYRNSNRQVVFRFYLDYPSNKKHMDIPEWLYDEINGDGTWYDNSYGKGFSPNYANENLIKYYTEAVNTLGNKYGNDDFFLYIEFGGIGHWGEWHVNVDEGMPVLPDYEIRSKYIEPFINSFKQSMFLMRYPLLESSNYNTGLYNDMLGDDTEDLEWLKSMSGGIWSQTEKSELTNKVDTWKKLPIGGEFTSSYDSDYILGTNFQHTIKMLQDSHQTFIGPKIIIDEDSRDYTNQIDNILKNLGHRLYVENAKISSKDQSINVTLTMANDGVAPIYTTVKTVVYLYNANGDVIADKEITDGININEITASKNSSYEFKWENIKLKQDNIYTLCIALLNENEEPIIELAMDKEYSDKVYEIGKFSFR